MDPQKVKEYYQEIQKAIDKVGYAIQGVFPNDEGICVCYTMGLTPLLGAECIVAGPVSLQTLYQTLRSNIDELIKDKEQLSEKEFVGGLWNTDIESVEWFDDKKESFHKWKVRTFHPHGAILATLKLNLDSLFQRRNFKLALNIFKR